MSLHTSRDEEISETVQSLRRIVKTIEDYSQQVSSEFGITGPQLWALKTISEHGALPLGQLSKKMYLHPSTVTGVVDRLENKGYVMRGRDATDRRIVTVSLTATGQEVVKTAPHPVQGKMIYGLRKLNGDELHVIYESVRKLAEIVEADNVEVTFFFDKE
jgi:MarR family transcriptional regulator, organic hydroperoxide resistance regulator